MAACASSGNVTQNFDLDALIAATPPGQPVNLPPGKHRVAATTVLNDLRTDLILDGNGKTELVLNRPLLRVATPAVAQGSLTRVLDRGSTRLELDKSGIAPGDIITFRSEDIVEENWNTKAYFTTTVHAVGSGSMTLRDPATFTFTPAARSTYVVRRPVEVALRGLTLSSSSLTKGDRAVIVTGAKVQVARVEVNSGQRRGFDFIELQGCMDSRLSQLTLGGLRYGVLINYSGSTTVESIVANDVYHAVAPATWSTQVLVQGYRGTNTAIDAHPSFDVTYRDVDIDCGNRLFNCRALGVRLENCRFRAQYPGTGKVYIGVSKLTKPYEFLKREYDVVFKTVNWLPEANQAVGFSVYGARDLTVDDVVTDQLVTTSFVTRTRVRNSRLGSIRSYNGDVVVENSVLDGNLYPGSGPFDAAITTSYQGRVDVIDTAVRNYGSALLGYVFSPKAPLRFERCTIENVNALVKETGYKQNRPPSVSFVDCRIGEEALLKNTGIQNQKSKN